MVVTDEQIRKDFTDHVATFTKVNEDISILEWKEPGTYSYYVKYVFDKNMVYISGDLGEAIFSLTWNAKPSSFKGINLGYFYEKLSAYGEDKKDFDTDLAIQELEEHFKERFEDWVGEYEEEELKAHRELLENLKELASECNRVDEWAYLIRSSYDDELTDYDNDYWEWAYDVGSYIPVRIQSYLVGLKMAAEQLEEQ